MAYRFSLIRSILAVPITLYYGLKASKASKNGKYEQAISLYKKSVKYNPDDWAAYLNMGNAYCGKKDYRSAISYYEKAIHIYPNNASVFFNMGVAYINLDNVDKQIESYKKAAQLGHERAQQILKEKGISYY